MLRVTYLGHAGWSIESGDHAVLVDPILTADFGRGPVGARMPALWPPRSLSFERFPRLDAVVISHEHEDHFNLRSFHLLDRSIPIFLSSRATVSAYTVLEEMGFRAYPFAPGSPVRLGSLELTALAPDHIMTFNSDEWDGLGLVARDTNDGGCFFSPIDIRVTRDMIQRVTLAVQDAIHILAFHYDHLAWLPVDSLEKRLSAEPENAAEASQATAIPSLRESQPLKILPGVSITVNAKDILRFDDSTDYIQTLPSHVWPERPLWRYHPEGKNYAPACGRYELSSNEWNEIHEGLEQFAQFLYGSVLYRRLYSLTTDRTTEPKPSFLMLLLQGNSFEYLAFEYRPRSCSFQPVSCPDDPFAEYLCGVECWCTDLLALIRGDFEPRILSIGHSRFWRPDKSIPDPFLHLIWPFFHPQRRPEECLAGYRKQMASLNAGTIHLFHAVETSLTAV